jgi:hypothetical protein
MSIFDTEKDGIPILCKLTMNREFSIFEYEEEPIVFVSSENGNIYLVDCVEPRDDVKEIGFKCWVVGKTNIITLIKLVKQEITLFDALKAVDRNVAVFKKHIDGTCHQKIVDADLLESNECPEKTAYVRFPEDNCEEEITRLYLTYFLGQTLY